jgi:hypothetical protein
MAKKFYAQKDALGFPIPGTMMSVPDTSSIPKDSILIPAQNVTAGYGQAVVSQPSKLRYFVRKDRSGNIIPNSLTISLVKPQGSVYEFKNVQGKLGAVTVAFTVGTPAATSVDITLTVAGILSSDTVTAGTILLGTSPNVTLANATKTQSLGSVKNGTNTVTVTGLTGSTNYYIRVVYTNGTNLTSYSTEATFTTAVPVPTYTVGQSALGGVIAYILQPGDPGYDTNVQHGFVISSQLSANAQWGCSGTDISGTDATIGTGTANTTAIIAGCSTAGTAARLCSDLVEGGYSDWYLPSVNELFAIRNNIFVSGMPAIYNANLWSSTQVSSTEARSVVYSFSPFISTVAKNNTSVPFQQVYAFRSF